MLDPNARYRTMTAAEAKLGIVTVLLMGLSFGQTSERAADAKLEVFEIALGDVPAWAVDRAARRWLRGECPPEVDHRPNYNFPPSPSTLRALALLETGPYRSAAAVARRVVEALPFERALDPTPLDRQPADGGLKITMRRM